MDRGPIFCACGCGREIIITQHHYYNGVPKYIQGHHARTPESRSVQSARSKIRKLSSEHKKKLLRTGKKNTPKHTERIRVSQRARSGVIREISLRLWKTTSFVKKQQRSRHITPNRAEEYLRDLLEKHLPGQWWFVGNLELVIDGKCPDFVHTRRKLIIELFGDYWHKPEEVAPRTKLFEKHGYRTLVIWEHELRGPETIQKILDFVGEE